MAFRLLRPISCAAVCRRRWIRTDRIVTLNSALIVKSIGQVSSGIVDAAVKRFCARIGYP